MDRPSEISTLPAEQQERIDELCDEYESSWKAGERADMVALLDEFEGAPRRVLLKELLRIDFEYRSRESNHRLTLSDLPAFHWTIESEVENVLNDLAPLAIASRTNDSDPAQDTSAPVSDADSTGDFELVELPGTPISDPPEGELLELGSYVLEEQIGRGGMGTVWKAYHRNMQRPVAVKLLAGDRLGDRKSRERFLREMRAIGQIDHDNFVRAYDAGESAGHLFIAMELLQGETLSQLVRRNGPLPCDEVCRLILPVTEAMQYAHECGSIHRDIKPGNIMITASQKVKVLDLGLARLTQEQEELGQLTQDWEVLGTGDFMSPEQFSDPRLADARSDIYSLGCTLYFMLTGRAPFRGIGDSNIVHKATAHRREPVPPLRQFRSDLPPALQRLIERMLAKKPSHRPADMREVASVLEHCLSRDSSQEVIPEHIAAAESVVVEPRRQQSGRPHNRLHGRPASMRQWLLLAVCFVIGALLLLAGLGWLIQKTRALPSVSQVGSGVATNHKPNSQQALLAVQGAEIPEQLKSAIVARIEQQPEELGWDGGLGEQRFAVQLLPRTPTQEVEPLLERSLVLATALLVNARSIESHFATHGLTDAAVLQKALHQIAQRAAFREKLLPKGQFTFTGDHCVVAVVVAPVADIEAELTSELSTEIVLALCEEMREEVPASGYDR